MKTKIALLVMMVIFSTSIFAQKPNQQRTPLEPQEMAKKMTERMKEKLSLSTEQEKKVYDIYFDFAQKQEALRKENSDKREEQMKLRKEQQEKISSVLTPEQKGKMEEMQKNREKKHEGMPNKEGKPKGQRGKM